MHAVLIERDGRLVYEEYFSGQDARRGRSLGFVTFTRDTLHDLRSVTKSVVSARVGAANASGAIRSLDARCWTTFPDTLDLQVPERRRIATIPPRPRHECRARMERGTVLRRSEE